MPGKFDDREFEYHIEPDEQSRESGGLFYYGNVSYWESNYRIVPECPKGSEDVGSEFTDTGDTEQEVKDKLYAMLANAQELLDHRKQHAEEDAEAAKADLEEEQP